MSPKIDHFLIATSIRPFVTRFADNRSKEVRFVIKLALLGYSLYAIKQALKNIGAK